MGLVITWKPGDKIYIDGIELVLLRIIQQDHYFVECAGKEFVVRSGEWTTLAEGCDIRSTLPKTIRYPFVKIQINAPGMSICRGTFKPKGVVDAAV